MKYMTMILLFVSGAVFSQAPQAFKYQGVLQAEGQPISEQPVKVRIHILSGTINGASVYSESHQVTTSVNGAFNLDIGKGTIISGAFNTIRWSENSHFVKIEIDADNNNVFENAGTTQLVSVPYALHAQTSGDEPWKKSEDNIYYNEGNVGIGTDAPQEALHINGNLRGNQLGGSLRVKTDFGSIDMGPRNSDYGHFYTDMPYGFYFGASVTVREHLIGYKESDLHISTQSGTTFQPVKRLSILNSNGYVGVGKTNPQYLLDVNGPINATSFLINGVPIGSNGAAGGWTVSGANVYRETGNVGIGTSSPSEALHVNGNIRGNQIGGSVRVKTDFGYIDMGPRNADYGHFYTDMPYGFYFGASVTVREHLIGYKESDLHISTQSNIDFQPVKRISILNANGNVGIGIAQPTAKLQVQDGDVYLNTVGKGVIMKSPNGQCWRMTVTNAGAPQFTSITCP